MQSTRRATPNRASARGFSIIELLIVVAISTVGFVALFQLQAGSLRGMKNMRHISEATMLAENFLEQLRFEFMAWTGRADGQLGAIGYPHLAGLPTGAGAVVGAQSVEDVSDAVGWVIGDADFGASTRTVSRIGDLDPTFGTNAGLHAALMDMGPDGTPIEQPYCLHYRLTWLIPDRAIRAEVEVSWPMEGANIADFEECDILAASQLHQARSITLNTTFSSNMFWR